MAGEFSDKAAMEAQCYANFTAQKAAGLRRAQTRFFSEIHRAEEEMGCKFEWPRLRLAPRAEEVAA